jgi:hypothetical protein
MRTAHCVGVAMGEGGPAMFQRVRAAAQHDDLRRQVERSRGDVEKQVEPLLFGEAADHRQQRQVGTRCSRPISACSAALLRPCPRAGAGRSLCARWRSRAGFHSRVSMPLRMPERFGRAMAQQAGHAHAFGIGLDLAGVARAHRVDRGRHAAGRP